MLFFCFISSKLLIEFLFGDLHEVITSASGESPSELKLFASTTDVQAPGRPTRLKVTLRRLDAYFTGTGGRRCRPQSILSVFVLSL
jgi:hypothetical protein